MFSVRILLFSLPLAALPGGPALGDDAGPIRFDPINSRAVAAVRTASLPDYVTDGDGQINWLDFGVESRSRIEWRDQNYQTPDLISEDAFYQRSLLYLGIHDVIDPLRFAAEFEDSRRGLSDRPESAGEQNHTELLQAYGELHLDDALGGEPLSLRVGRMTLDAVDRRLIARNRYRNTINAFDGIRLKSGDESSPIEWDAFALRPVRRSVDALDESSEEGLLYGLTGYVRDLSPNLVVEPYWLYSDEETGGGKQIHTGGVHTFGRIGDSDWDYDFDFAGQWGESGGLDHQAWAGHAEIGHAWDHPWKPRLAAWLNYASGDRSPLDGDSGRFDPLYGASFAFYGYTSYFSWQNLINPAMRLSFQPHEDLKCELIHRGVWLASGSDAWVRGSRVDPAGASGRYVGQELDLRASWQVCDHLEIEAVYACFFPGEFVSGTGTSPETHFGYLAATIRY